VAEAAVMNMFPMGFGFRCYVGTGTYNSLRFGLWNAGMLGLWAFGATGGVLLALRVFS
jgi:hypothetical protein